MTKKDKKKEKPRDRMGDFMAKRQADARKEDADRKKNEEE